VSGVITDTTWTAGGSPYIVTGAITLTAGYTLTIEPGVQVRFDSGAYLRIEGTLIARGLAAQPITLTANRDFPNAGDWGYVHFTDASADAAFDANWSYTGGSILEYAIVEYGGGISSVPAAVRLESAAPYIRNATIRNNARRGLYVSGASPRIIGNTIRDNGAASPTDKGGGIYTESACTIQGNTVQGNAVAISADYATGGGAGIWAVNSTIYNNTVTGNTANSTYAGGNLHGGGVYASGGQVVSNTISSNTAQGTRNDHYNYVRGGGLYATGVSLIQQNAVTGNTARVVATAADYGRGWVYGGGIYASGGTLQDNTISGNTASANAYRGAQAYGGGAYGGGSLLNNTITGNTAWANASWGYESVIAYGGGVSDAGVLQRNTITGNSVTASNGTHDAYAYGGGVNGGSSLSDNVISGNTVQCTAPSGRTGNAAGGGVNASSATLTNNTVRDNEVTASRTHVYGGGVNCDTCTMSGNTIVGNQSNAGQNVYGGGARFVSGANNFTGNVVALNEATAGAGVYGGGLHFSTAGLCDSNTIADNTASAPTVQGAGVYISSNNHFRYNNVVRNTGGSAAVQGAGVYHVAQTTAATIRHNTVAANQPSATNQVGGLYVSGRPDLNDGNNLHSAAGYELYYSSASSDPNLDARNIFWGHTVESLITRGIYDWFDNATLGLVDYAPYAATRDLDAPPSPPSGLRLWAGNGVLYLSWDANPETDIAGYKVYYDTDGGLPYQEISESANQRISESANQRISESANQRISE
jgi:hypothetical protein